MEMAMPIELLKAIVEKPLPLTITEPSEIDKLRVLRAADCVVALLPAIGTTQTFARVLHVTPKGLQAAQSLESSAVSSTI
jgi:hypothetical protein